MSKNGNPETPDISPEDLPPKVAIHLEYDLKTTQLKISGPVGNPVLFLGIIERAKAHMIGQMTAGDIMRQMSKQKQIIPAATLGFNPKKRG